MKRLLALSAAALLLLSAGCGADNITIVTETTTSLSQTNETDIEKLAPQNIDVTIPISFPASAEEIDARGGVEILAEEARNPEIANLLGADAIVRCAKYDIYFITSFETPSTYLYIPDGDDAYMVYYIDGVLSRVVSSSRSWYFRDNQLDFMVVLHTSSNGGFATFYDNDGSKVFFRLSYQYFGPDYVELDSDEMTEITARFGKASEFYSQ